MALGLAAVLVAFQNCAPPEHSTLSPQQAANIPASSFLKLKSDFLDAQCLYCHDVGDPNFNSYATLMAGSTVVPGQPNSSTFYTSIASGAMPKGGAPLSTAQIDAVYEWIANGALESELVGLPPILSASGISSEQITLSWEDNTLNESGFKIERGSSLAGPFVQIQVNAENTTSFADVGLSPNTNYFYRVLPFNTSQSGAYSNVASAATQPAPTEPPLAPTALTATVLNSSSIHLSWQDNSNDEINFRVELSTDGAVFSEIAQVASGITSFDSVGLSAATTYFYRVRAVNSSGFSTYTNVASGKTIAAITATYSSLKANIFDSKCLSCHSGNVPKGNYNMSNYAGVVSRVVPGNSATSLLYLRTNDGTMPKGSKLTVNELNQIKTWIDAGAFNN